MQFLVSKIELMIMEFTKIRTLLANRYTAKLPQRSLKHLVHFPSCTLQMSYFLVYFPESMDIMLWMAALNLVHHHYMKCWCLQFLFCISRIGKRWLSTVISPKSIVQKLCSLSAICSSSYLFLYKLKISANAFCQFENIC